MLVIQYSLNNKMEARKNRSLLICCLVACVWSQLSLLPHSPRLLRGVQDINLQEIAGVTKNRHKFDGNSHEVLKSNYGHKIRHKFNTKNRKASSHTDNNKMAYKDKNNLTVKKQQNQRTEGKKQNKVSAIVQKFDERIRGLKKKEPLKKNETKLIIKSHNNQQQFKEQYKRNKNQQQIKQLQTIMKIALKKQEQLEQKQKLRKQSQSLKTMDTNKKEKLYDENQEKHCSMRLNEDKSKKQHLMIEGQDSKQKLLYKQNKIKQYLICQSQFKNYYQTEISKLKKRIEKQLREGQMNLLKESLSIMTYECQKTKDIIKSYQYKLQFVAQDLRAIQEKQQKPLPKTNLVEKNNWRNKMYYRLAQQLAQD